MPPAPMPQRVTPEELLNRALVRIPASAMDGARRVAGAIGSVQGLRSALAGTVEFAESLGRVLGSSGQPSPLLAGRSLRRRCAAFDVGFRDLKRTGRIVDASVNDVYLGCVAAALRRYHEAMGEPVEGLPMAIPVAFHRPADAAARNHFGAILVAAPLAVKDTAERLALISRIVHQGRVEPARVTMGMMAPVLARLPGSMLRALASSTPRPDILASGFQGPTGPTYFAGARILKSYTFGPAPGVAAMFTMASIGGSGCVSVNYDPAAITRSDLFARCLAQGFRETLRLGGSRPRVGPVIVGRMRDQEMAA
jgi:diacylglycerol O-acyltransferase